MIPLHIRWVPEAIWYTEPERESSAQAHAYRIEWMMDAATDAPSHLSDSEFWRLCHDLPANEKDDRVGAYPSIATKNAAMDSNPFSGIVSILEFSHESDEGIDPKHSDESDEAAQSSSDDSLLNLYTKKNHANDLFIESHANRVNTQRIYDTIDLIDDHLKQNDRHDYGGGVGAGHDSDAKFNSLTSNESSNGSATTTTTTSTSASNADDLLIKIANNLKQLKENVSEIGVTVKSDVDKDLIDFNDDNDQKTYPCNGEF